MPWVGIVFDDAAAVNRLAGAFLQDWNQATPWSAPQATPLAQSSPTPPPGGVVPCHAAARLARYIRNDAAFNLLFNAREELRRGTQLVIFPEGSRTKKFPVDPFLPTAAVIARRTGIPVQTLLITFSSPYLGKGWPLFGKPDLPLEISVRLGRRFPAQKDIGAFTVQLEEYFRTELGTFGASTATGATAS